MHLFLNFKKWGVKRVIKVTKRLGFDFWQLHTRLEKRILPGDKGGRRVKHEHSPQPKAEFNNLWRFLFIGNFYCLFCPNNGKKL
jgi:hypothetical protein